QVVVDGLRRDRERDAQHVRVMLNQHVGHIRVGRADLHQVLDRLRDASTRAGRGRGDLHVGVRGGESRDPEVEQRVQQAGAGLDQSVRGMRGGGGGNGGGERQSGNTRAQGGRAAKHGRKFHVRVPFF